MPKVFPAEKSAIFIEVPISLNMQKPLIAGGDVEVVSPQTGGTKGHSKPGTGGTHAGPPPPPQPKK